MSAVGAMPFLLGQHQPPEGHYSPKLTLFRRQIVISARPQQRSGKFSFNIWVLTKCRELGSRFFI